MEKDKGNKTIRGACALCGRDSFLVYGMCRFCITIGKPKNQDKGGCDGLK